MNAMFSDKLATIAQVKRLRPFALPLIVILAGTCLLAYVAAEYGYTWASQHRMYEELRAQASAPQVSSNGLSSNGLSSNGLSSNGLSSQLTSARLTPASGRVAGKTNQGSIPTRLLIPSIHLDAMVVEGTSRSALLAGPGHMEDTAFPGDAGNSIIAGHRDTFFRRLGELNLGDQIVVQRHGQQFRYNVVAKTIVDADDSEVLSNSAPGLLTLITCYPIHYIGPAPRRLVIEAKLVAS